ncbi:MAG: hypothetical protein OSJ54_12120 [Oscillospiraceae bacterium]|nr:hypothetical protein [Oscillospiraceae bacterium]
MSTINLIIGGVDVSERVEVESYSVRKVWKTASEFTKFDGNEIANRVGCYYELSVSFEDVPDGLMRTLTCALDSDTIEITFTDPHSENADGCTTAVFGRGESTGGKVANELDEGLSWNFGISLKSEVIPAEGCL